MEKLKGALAGLSTYNVFLHALIVLALAIACGYYFVHLEPEREAFRARIFKLNEELRKREKTFADIAARSYQSKRATVILIGPSGVGKSSLIRDSLRFLEPERTKYLPEVKHGFDASTLRPRRYDGVKVDQANGFVHSYSFIDTRGLFDDTPNNDTWAQFATVLEADLCKVDLVVVCFEYNRVRKDISQFFADKLQSLKNHQMVLFAITKCNDMSDVEYGKIQEKIRKLIKDDSVALHHTKMDEWDAETRSYAKEPIKRFLDQIDRLLEE